MFLRSLEVLPKLKHRLFRLCKLTNAISVTYSCVTELMPLRLTQAKSILFGVTRRQEA